VVGSCEHHNEFHKRWGISRLVESLLASLESIQDPCKKKRPCHACALASGMKNIFVAVGSSVPDQ